MRTTKLFSISLLALSALFITACGSEKSAEQHASDQASAEEGGVPVTYQVNLENSTVNWRGEMVGPNLIDLIKYHEGNLKLNAGTIVLAGKQVKSGSFIVDMTTIDATDSNFNEDYPEAKLLGHLASADFFDAGNYPTASFTLNKVEGNTGTGTLSIRGKSSEETIENIRVEEMGDHFMVYGDLTFDRQKFDVKFDMGMADMIVADEIKLNIVLATGAKK